MKVKEAVQSLQARGETSLYAVERLYGDEMISRVELRSHGRRMIRKTLVEGVLKEMDDWILKVCRELGWTEEACKKTRDSCRQTVNASLILAIKYTQICS